MFFRQSAQSRKTVFVQLPSICYSITSYIIPSLRSFCNRLQSFSIYFIFLWVDFCIFCTMLGGVLTRIWGRCNGNCPPPPPSLKGGGNKSGCCRTPTPPWGLCFARPQTRAETALAPSRVGELSYYNALPLATIVLENTKRASGRYGGASPLRKQGGIRGHCPRQKSPLPLGRGLGVGHARK